MVHLSTPFALRNNAQPKAKPTIAFSLFSQVSDHWQPSCVRMTPRHSGLSPKWNMNYDWGNQLYFAQENKSRYYSMREEGCSGSLSPLDIIIRLLVPLYFLFPVYHCLICKRVYGCLYYAIRREHERCVCVCSHVPFHFKIHIYIYIYNLFSKSCASSCIFAVGFGVARLKAEFRSLLSD
jgi:hypothetical protein